VALEKRLIEILNVSWDDDHRRSGQLDSVSNRPGAVVKENDYMPITRENSRRHTAPNVGDSSTGCRRRPAFTIVELLVVIAIIGTLIALLLPAVQSARESGHRVACQNNMRQLGIAILGFESMHKVLPPSGWTKVGPGNPAGKHVSWRALILPYVELTSLHDLYDFREHWWDGINLTAGAVEIELFLCPSVPDRKIVTSAVAHDIRPAMSFPKPLAPNDYEAIMGVHTVVNPTLYASEAARRSAMYRNSQIQMGGIFDGAAHTILIVECAARPLTFQRRSAKPDVENDQGLGWVDSEGPFSLDGSNSAGTTQGCGPTGCGAAINATNFNEPYAFHPAGANFLFADGHVAFFTDDMPLETLAALCTRAGREIVSVKDG
jgi:prepilin-type processing-associated H-X9-DG protein/prepilin-type N-terminal cleavage/methylation domain-containing protein